MTTIPKEILPCPFCGSENVDLANTHTPAFWVECEDCGAQVDGGCIGDSAPEGQPFSYSNDPTGPYDAPLWELPLNYQESAMSAIEAWNRRAPIPHLAKPVDGERHEKAFTATVKALEAAYREGWDDKRTSDRDDTVDELWLLSDTFYTLAAPPAAVQEPVAVKDATHSPQTSAMGINADLLKALKYVRRYLKPEDHDVSYVDDVIDNAEGRGLYATATEVALSTSQSDPAPEIAALRAENERLRKALEPFAKYVGDPSQIKQRAFLQLLICPLGDEHPDNHVPHFQAARAALSSQEGSDV
ncbi:hypothetical protein G6L30_07930 [Agrobacterium rhizogenes]|nr:hypothetical protein [Rhizobium rhizogenes]